MPNITAYICLKHNLTTYPWLHINQKALVAVYRKYDPVFRIIILTMEKKKYFSLFRLQREEVFNINGPKPEYQAIMPSN